MPRQQSLSGFPRFSPSRFIKEAGVTGVRLLTAALFAALATFTSPPPAHAAAYVVNTTADNTTDDTSCTLREAINAANNTGGSNTNCGALSNANDTITFSVSGTITLGSQLPYIVSGQGTLTINGGSAVTISGNNAVRVFYVGSGASLTLQNLTVANGAATGDYGGGVYNAGGTVVITGTTFSGNSASGAGGGLYNTVSTGTVTITNSTFSNNSAGDGGGVSNSVGTVTITNSTFSGNGATINGGGLLAAVGSVTLRNTIVANSTSGNNCSGTITNGGDNLDSGSTCGWGTTSGSLSSTDPLLGALTGSPAYFPLNTGSPAIDAVIYNAPNNCPANDQRGAVRPQGAYCDVGAYESTIDLTATKTNDSGGAVTLGNSFNWTITVQNTGAGPVSFTDGQTILQDTLPVGPTYGLPAVQNVVNVTNNANIQCVMFAIFPGLFCSASGATVTLGAATGRFDVIFSVAPNATGTLTNPTGGGCSVDPNALFAETSETNNNCLDTLTITDVPVSQSVGASGGTFIATGGTTTVAIPPSTVPEGSTLRVAPPAPGSAPQTGSAFKLLTEPINIEIVDNTGANLGTFNTPLTICMKYTDADLLAAGGNVSNFVIQTAQIGGTWRQLPTTVDQTAKKVCATVDHLTLFALTTSVPTTLPATAREFSAPPIRDLGRSIDNLSPRGGVFFNAYTGARVTVPHNIAQTGWTITMRPVSSAELGSLTTSVYALGGLYVEIAIRDGNGNLVADWSGAPLTIGIPFTAADLARVGGDVNKLLIIRNPGQPSEQVITTGRTVDFANMIIYITTTRLSIWSLGVPKPTAPPAPKATAPRTVPQNNLRPTASPLPTRVAAIPIATATRALAPLRPGELRWTMGPSGGTILDTTSSVWLTILPNTLAEGAAVFIRAVDPNIIPQTEGVHVLQAAEVNMRDVRGNAITTLSQPMRACLRYNDEQLKQAGGAANLLILQNPGRANEKELAFARTASPDSQMVCAETTELGTFALARRKSEPDTRATLMTTVLAGAALTLVGGAALLGALAMVLWVRGSRRTS